jgi:tetratricopeptide (TPR) repeat protein
MPEAANEGRFALTSGLSILQCGLMFSHVHIPIAILVFAMQVGVGNQPPVAADSPYLVQWRKCMADSGPPYEAGRLAEATRVLEKALGYAQHFAPNDPRLPTTLHALGFLYQQQGKYVAAASQYRRAIRLWKQMGPEQHDALLMSTDNLIATYLESGEYAAGRKLMKSRLPDMERSASSWQDRATLLNMRAALAKTQHRFGEAERSYRESLSLWQHHSRAKESAIVLMNLSYVFSEMKRYQNGLDTMLEALAILETLDATERPLVIQSLDRAGSLYMKLRRPGDAGAAYNRALGLAETTFGAEHVLTGAIMLRYSTALRALGQQDQAKALASTAKTILGRSKEKLTVEVHELARYR